MNTLSLPLSAVTTFFHPVKRLSSPCCPSVLPLCLTIAKAQGVKFNSADVGVPGADTHTNLHGCLHVPAQYLFPNFTHPSPPILRHTNTFKHASPSLSLCGRIPVHLTWPWMWQMVLAVNTLGIQARRVGGQRRGLCVSGWEVTGQMKAECC